MGVAACACNPSSWEMEEGRPGMKGQPLLLHNQFEAWLHEALPQQSTKQQKNVLFCFVFWHGFLQMFDVSFKMTVEKLHRRYFKCTHSF